MEKYFTLKYELTVAYLVVSAVTLIAAFIKYILYYIQYRRIMKGDRKKKNRNQKQ